MANIGLTMVPWATCNLPSSHPPERSATSANFKSEDMQTWQYLGEQWHANHVWRPRAWSVSIKHILASTISPFSRSAPRKGKTTIFLWASLTTTAAHSSHPPPLQAGCSRTGGGNYAGAIVQAPDNRSLFWTWVQAGAYNLGKLSPPASLDCDLSLPRVLEVASDGQPT